MLKRDFIMVQIEELGKVIAQIIDQRNTDNAQDNPALIQSVYNSLKVDHKLLMNEPPHDIRHFLDGEDGAGLQRLEIAVRLLIEEAYLNVEEQQKIRERAKLLLEYLQARDNTFSLERVELLNELNRQLQQG